MSKPTPYQKALEAHPIVSRTLGVVVLLLNTAIWWKHIANGGPAILFLMPGLAVGIGLLLTKGWSGTVCFFTVFVMSIVVATTWSGNPGLEERRVTMILTIVLMLIPIAVPMLLQRYMNKSQAK